MGYWEMNKSVAELMGDSVNAEVESVWGDGPADIMGEAIDEIVKEFEEDYGRVPTKTEIVKGLLFSLLAMDELPD